MKIRNVEAIPLRGQGDQGAYGAPYGLILRIATDSGLIGYGETDSMPSVVKAVVEAPFLNEMMSGLVLAFSASAQSHSGVSLLPLSPYPARSARCRRWLANLVHQRLMR